MNFPGARAVGTGVTALLASLVLAQTPVRAADGSFTLTLPKSWVRVDKSDARLAPLLKRTRKGYPGLYRQMRSVLDTPGRFDFFAVDGAAVRPKASFAECGYSVDLPGPGEIADEKALRNFAAGIADSLPNAKTVGARFVDLPTGRAARVTTRFTLDSETGPVVLVTQNYVVTHKGKTRSIAWTTVPSREAKYLPVFDAAMQSLRFRD